MADEKNDLSAQDIETIASLHARTQKDVNSHQRMMERITARVGTPSVLYSLVVLIVVWIVANVFSATPIDRPPFAWVETALSIYAALVTTIVLVAQNRQGKAAEQRAYLDLQVNLLVDRKTAKLIALVEELRRDLPNVRNRHDAQAQTMAKAVDAHAAVDALESMLDDSEPPKKST